MLMHAPSQFGYINHLPDEYVTIVTTIQDDDKTKMQETKNKKKQNI